jgi:hypothetical protein
MWISTLAVALVLLATTPASAQLDPLLRGAPGIPGLPSAPPAGLSEARIVSGLKEALQIGTQNTVNLTGKADGYFLNQAIKILMPEKLRTLEKGLRAVGYGPRVDEFVLSMNRSAEKAAPFAKEIFWNAIGEMTFEDVRKIFSGHETAATDYFKGKTSDKLTVVFKPIVGKTMNEVGVTRQYKELVGRYEAIPFVMLWPKRSTDCFMCSAKRRRRSAQTPRLVSPICLKRCLENRRRKPSIPEKGKSYEKMGQNRDRHPRDTSHSVYRA